MNGRRGEWVTKSKFLDFEPSARSEMLEGLAEEFGPVAHTDIEKAEVDEVEGRWKVQSDSMSSTSNEQFGGTKAG